MSDWIMRLKENLQLPLPGIAAHLEMASGVRKLKMPDYDTISGYRESAVCILLYQRKGEHYFPLIERSSYEGVHSGQMALPGGKRDEGDHDEVATAIREMQEETGYIAQKLEVIGKLSRIYIPPSNFMVYPVVTITEEEPIFEIDKREVEVCHEVHLNWLIQQETTERTSIEIAKNSTVETPYFNFNGKVIWGATAMILNELRLVLRKSL